MGARRRSHPAPAGAEHIGIADASIVVLAERHGVNTVLSLDERHFHALRIDRRKRFRIQPFDG